MEIIPMEFISGVYKIINKVNGKFYIGSTVNFNKRWNSHKKELKNNNHHSQYLQNSWNKYGEENFIFEVVEYTGREFLLEREQYYIDKLRPWKSDIGYNGSSIAGKIEFTEEVRKKISIANSGESCGLSILAKGQVEEIRRMYNETNLSQQKIADIYCVSRGCIQRIVENNSWKDNEYEPLTKGKEFYYKLDNDKTNEIKKDFLSGKYTYKHLSEKYEVSLATINNIINGIVWNNENNIQISTEQKNVVIKKNKDNLKGNNNPSKRQEVRKKISISQLGEKNHMYGKKHSKQTKKKMSESHKGKVFTQETRNKLSISQRGEKSKNSLLTWNMIKEIRFIYKNNKISQQKIANMYNISRSTIQKIVENRSWCNIL